LQWNKLKVLSKRIIEELSLFKLKSRSEDIMK
jgi:hypothetical protein